MRTHLIMLKFTVPLIKDSVIASILNIQVKV